MSVTAVRFRELLGFEDRGVTLVSRQVEPMGDYVIEHLRLRIGDEEVRGILTRPAEAEGPLPAILYGHSHGGGYAIGARELLDGREYLVGPLGPVFARAGYVTFCIDMPVFGERATVTESFAAKALLWHGKSLFGQMLCDHAAALTYLCGREDVDASRVGAFGLSMGCVLSYWLAALDKRISAVAHLCCFADFRTMIALGAHDGHGIYLTVPGLLKEADGGSIAALIAPRPQLICVGEADHLSPPEAVDRAMEELRPAYAGAPGMLEYVSEPGVGHQETPSMRAAVFAFFRRHLG
ncbi:acetylxylan esterase [Devosia sp. XJ19-1]|uniref:Acetylxylan esterase n=1 Tax=Devosia ureilytica TaxID=2952754 RepID=A0A9Q4AN17_9HYPH|nr:acetylxylan esterase [Devosia ureilytica]MCP8883595.1 acetylxylan esterase [Devosia ureilytica]MCP8887203.1 acetylxylan esterase [Devosia ureilytica]